MFIIQVSFLLFTKERRASENVNVPVFNFHNQHIDPDLWKKLVVFVNRKN